MKILDNLTVSGTISKVGGTSTQFLKADGSLDSSAYVTGTPWSGQYLPLAGGIVTGNLNLASFSSLVVTGSLSNYYTGNNTSLMAQSPMTGIWHDLFAFKKAYTVTYENSVDGTNWTSGTLDAKVFAQKQNQNVQIINKVTQVGARWTFSSVSWGSATWLMIGYSYDVTGSTKLVLVESSVDGVAWTTRHTSTYTNNADNVNHYIISYAGDTYLRVTITKTDAGVTGAININSLKLMSARPGDQGLGKEYEFPYIWDENQKVTFVDQTTTPKLLIGSGAFLTNSYFRIGQSLNAHIQGNINNTNAGTLASSDWVATANNGTDTTNFINFGINSSANADPAWTMAGANDGYLFTNGGHLTVGTASSAKDIKFFTGGTLAANEKARIFGATGNFSLGNIVDSGYKFDVTGTGRFSGNVTAPTFSGALSGNATTATNLTGLTTTVATLNLVSGTNTGDNAVNSLYSGLVSNATHTGDATGSTALTLATVNSNIGQYGSASSVPQVTVNAKGLTTVVSNVSITIAESQVTGLISDLAGKEPSFFKNTAFNKNFGISAGTVAEGNDNRILNGQSAYGWGNHAGLYRSIGYVPSWSEITSKPTTLSGFGVTDGAKSLGTADFAASTTTVAFLTDLNNKGFLTGGFTTGKGSWNYAGNSDISDTGFGAFELAGASLGVWNDGTNRTVLAIAPNTGAAAGQVLIYNDQGSGYSPGWRKLYTSNDFSATNISNWNTAYGWGNHIGLYLPLAGGTMTGALTINSTLNVTGLISGNGKQIFNTGDAWLRINENSAFTGGAYFGTSIVRTDSELQVGGSGSTFRAHSSVFTYLGNNILHAGNYGSYSTFSGAITGASLTVTGDVTAFSDARVKENIRPIKNVIERIQASRGIVYDRIDTKQKDNIGFIAQELEDTFPELVLTQEDGTKAVKYQNAVAVLFEAIKEQQKQIEELKDLVNKLVKS